MNIVKYWHKEEGINGFISLAVTQVEEAGVEVEFIFSPEDHKGYYIDGMSLVVNIWYEDWKETFLHEYCHFIQNKTKCKEQRKFIEKPTKKSRMAQLERDCELRVVGLMHFLGLDCNNYAEKANNEHLIPYYGDKYAI